MITVETIFSVILVFLFFIGPLVLFMRFALKLSGKTFEPLHQPRIYRHSYGE